MCSETHLNKSTFKSGPGDVNGDMRFQYIIMITLKTLESHSANVVLPLVASDNR